MLKQSLGGNSYSLMVACLSPSDAYAEENLSTLNYATKASKIQNQPNRQVNRYAKKKLGDSGTKIWSNTTRTPTTANRAAIATDWVADVQDTKGYKEVALMDADTTWKTVPKLKSSISYVMRLREPLLAMLRILSKHCEKQNFQKQERSWITSSPLQMHLRLKPGKHC